MKLLHELQEYVTKTCGLSPDKPMECKTEQPLATYTYMRTGGVAEAVVFPRTPAMAASVMAFCRDRSLPIAVIGKGSNTLFGTTRFSGIILSTARLTRITHHENTVTAMAGAALPLVCRYAAEHGLSGLEPLYGIPGSVGGAVYMNAGAYGTEISDLSPITEVVFSDSPSKIRTYSSAEQEFDYRHSIFTSLPNAIITRVTLSLSEGRTPREIKESMQAYLERRRMAQPLEFPSLGSIYKRPQTGYAAELIERAGLKNASVGGAAVSGKHTGFIINTGGATSADVLALMELIEEKVYRKFNVRLTPEICIVR